jgi:hypothetical protein
MTPLGSLYRGNTGDYTLTVSRTAPAMDLQAEGTSLVCSARSLNELRFQKTIGNGFTVLSATTAALRIAPGDTAGLPKAPLEITIVLSESDGRVTTLKEWEIELE